MFTIGFTVLDQREFILSFSYTDEFELIGPRGDEKHQFGSDTTLSCHLSPEISAAAMEIRWFKGMDCICLYKNRQVTEGKGYEGRVNLFTHELQRGNVSLQIRDCTESDRGYYLCHVTNGDLTEELTVRVWKIPPSRDRDFLVRQWHSEWTEEERLKMEESVLLTELKEERHPVLKNLMSFTEEKKSQEEKLKRAELENTAEQTDSIEELKEEEKQQEEREYIRAISLELREMQERRLRERVEMRQREEEEIRGKMRAVADDLRSSEEAVKKIKEKIEQHEKQKDGYNETLSEERNEEKRRELEKEMERENEQIKEAEEELKRMQEERWRRMKKLRLEMEIREKNALKADTHFIKKLPELISQTVITNRQKEFDRQMNEKDREIKTLKLNLSEMEKEKEKQIEERKKTLDEKKKKLQQKDAELEERTETIESRNKIIEEKNELLREKDTLLENTGKEVESCKKQLNTLRKELQDKSSTLQEMMILLELQKTELRENTGSLKRRKDFLVREKHS
uniref:Ig-like domain-containing protein n=1 Tax=Pygocentrus nattereri TaxID=42514 RepID=A0A3B4DQF4_PYGNA